MDNISGVFFADKTAAETENRQFDPRHQITCSYEGNRPSNFAMDNVFFRSVSQLKCKFERYNQSVDQ